MASTGAPPAPSAGTMNIGAMVTVPGLRDSVCTRRNVRFLDSRMKSRSSDDDLNLELQTTHRFSQSWRRPRLGPSPGLVESAY